MLTTVAGVGFLATLASAYRNMKAWDAYHRADVTRGQLVNQVFLTLMLLAGTIVVFLFRGLF